MLLRNAQDPRVDQALVGAVGSRHIPVGVRERIVEILSRRESQIARDEVARLAGVKLAVRHSTRRLRAAALAGSERS